MMKARRLRWTGHVTRVVNVRNAYKAFVGKLEGYWFGNPKGGDLWEDLGVRRRMILNIISRVGKVT
jgi:hypothetical protein